MGPSTLPRRRQVQPTVELLECRLAPAVFNLRINPAVDDAGAVKELIAAINTANGNNDPSGNTVNLLPGAVYTLIAPDNFLYGPDGLPAISSNLTINGQGATIQRGSAAGTPLFRFFYVSGGLSGLPAGSLTLQNVTLTGGLARGGGGGGFNGGGGGLGAGGAIFNQGTLTLNGVTLTGNAAQGGSSASTQLSTGGGGMGQDTQPNGVGGGFGGPFAGAGGKGSAGGGDFGQGGGAGGGGGGGFSQNGSPTGIGGGLSGLGGGGIGDGGSGADQGGSGGGVGGGGGGGTGPTGIGGDGGFGGGGGASTFTSGNNVTLSAGTGGFGGGGGAGAFLIGPGGQGGFGGGSGRGGKEPQPGGGAGMGGAVFSMYGTVTVTNSNFTANSAFGGVSGSQGGAAYGGAVFNLDGSVAVSNSTFTGNTVVSGTGPVPGASLPADGGVLYNLAYGNTPTGGAVTATAALSSVMLAGNRSGGGNDLANNQVDGRQHNTATLTQTGITSTDISAQFVQALYQANLGRQATTAEVSAWQALASKAAVAAGITFSSEAEDRLVRSWYTTYLGRAAMGGKETFWAQELAQGQPEEQVLSQLLGGTEFYTHAQSLVGSGTSDQRFVEALYQVFLNRTGSGSEAAGWVGTLPTIGRQGVIAGFLASQEYRADVVASYYANLLHRTPNASELNGWVTSGLDSRTVRLNFEGSPEFVGNS